VIFSPRDINVAAVATRLDGTKTDAGTHVTDRILTVGYLMLKNVSRLEKRLGSTPVSGLRIDTPG